LYHNIDRVKYKEKNKNKDYKVTIRHRIYESDGNRLDYQSVTRATSHSDLPQFPVYSPVHPKMPSKSMPNAHINAKAKADDANAVDPGKPSGTSGSAAQASDLPPGLQFVVFVTERIQNGTLVR